MSTFFKELSLPFLKVNDMMKLSIFQKDICLDSGGVKVKIEKIELKNNKYVTVTAYLLDIPSQFPNVVTRPAVVIYPGVIIERNKLITSQ